MPVYFTEEEEYILNAPDEKLDFSKMLRKSWLRFLLDNNQKVSQNDFARYLGIGNQNLTNYMLNQRTPSPEFAEKLADKLGMWVYDKLDMPRRLPRDKDILYVVDSMAEFNDQERKEMIETARNIRDRRKERGKPPSQTAMA